MPNHTHFIIQIVGADLRVCPDEHDERRTGERQTGERQTGERRTGERQTGEPKMGEPRTGEPRTGENTMGENTMGEPKTGENTMGRHTGLPLHRVVQWFKTMTTNEYIRGVKNNKWKPFDGKLWQRNYWEHIIRNENEHQHIAQYIINNPAKWKTDKLNGDVGNVVMESPVEYNSEIWMI